MVFLSTAVLPLLPYHVRNFESSEGLLCELFSWVSGWLESWLLLCHTIQVPTVSNVIAAVRAQYSQNLSESTSPVDEEKSKKFMPKMDCSGRQSENKPTRSTSLTAIHEPGRYTNDMMAMVFIKELSL